MSTQRIISAVVFSLLLAVPAMAQSPSSYDDRPDSWWRALEYQLNTSLNSDLEGVQATQMKNAIAMTTLYRNRIDLRPSVPAIIAFHRNNDDPQMRALAVAALQSIDSMESRRYLRKKVQPDEMEAARVEMVAVLSAYTAGAPVARL